MAQKLKAVDLGSWSLKVATLNRTLVGTGVAGVEEHPMASRNDGKGRDRECGKLLREVFGDKKLAGEAVTVGFPGEQVLNRKIEVPFTDRTKVDQILPFELEQHVPYSAEEIIGDYVMQKAGKGRPGADLFVSVVTRSDMEELLGDLKSAKLDPRVIGHPVFAMAKLESVLRSGASLEPMLLVDLGHTKTLAVLVLNGTILGVRSILRGGSALTRRLAKGLGVDMDEAERMKHAAHLYPAGQGEEGEGRTHEVAAWLREELLPIVRDLKMLLRSVAPDATIPIHIFGGGARLGGLPEFLTAELGQNAEILEASQLKMAIPQDLDDPGIVPALALALDSVRGGDSARINFRRIALPYVGDFRNLRGRLVYLGIMAFLMVVAFITPSFLKYQAMSDMTGTLEEEILSLSEEILGESLEDYEEVLSAFAEVPGTSSWIVYPDMTGLEAFYEVEAVIASIDGLPVEGAEEEPLIPDDEIPSEPELSPEELVLRELEGELPSLDEMPSQEPAASRVHGLKMNRIVVDMTNETKGINGVVEFTGDCSSVATLEIFETAVDKHPCFHNVVRADQQVVVAYAERKGWQRFSLNFNVACPKAQDTDRKKPGDVEAPKSGSEERDEGPSKLEERSRADEAPNPERTVGPPRGADSEPEPIGPTVEPVPEAKPGPVPTGKPGSDGPPHVGGPSATSRVDSEPLDRSGIPTPRTVDRPVGRDLKRRIPTIRPGR